MKIGDYSKAQTIYAQIPQNTLQFLYTAGTVWGEKDKQKVLQMALPYFNKFAVFADRHRTHDSLLVFVQDALLGTKGYALTGMTELLSLVKAFKNDELQRIYDQWVNTKERLEMGYNTSLENRKKQGINLDSLEKAANEQENQLMQASAVLKERLGYQKKQFYFKDLVAHVAKKEVAIDFLRLTWGGEADTTWYYALVTEAGASTPRYIPLCAEEELNLYAAAEIKPNQANYISQEEKSRALYRLLLAPLEPYWHRKKIIHWSPVGLMNQIALGTLLNEKGKRMTERFELHQYGSLKDFIVKKQGGVDGSTGMNNLQKTTLLVGDIAFDLDELEHKSLVETSTTTNLYASRALSVDNAGVL